MALPQTVAVGCRPPGQASTIACLPPQPGRQDAEQTRSQLDRRLDGQTMGRVGVLPLPDQGAAWRERRTYSRDRIYFSVSLIDFSHSFAEIMAYTEENGNYSSQKFPRKPDLP
jgi:hypothetical protein